MFPFTFALWRSVYVFFLCCTTHRLKPAHWVIIIIVKINMPPKASFRPFGSRYQTNKNCNCSNLIVIIRCRWELPECFTNFFDKIPKYLQRLSAKKINLSLLFCAQKTFWWWIYLFYFLCSGFLYHFCWFAFHFISFRISQWITHTSSGFMKKKYQYRHLLHHLVLNCFHKCFHQ